MFFKLLPTIGTKFLSKRIKNFSNYLNSISLILDKLDLMTEDEKNILSRNKIFKDIHKNKRAFVIVNGPSLKKHNLSLLKDEITFTVSGFWKHPVIKEWQPTYYCLSDPTFFKGGEDILDFFDELNKRITKSTFFIPLFRGYEANLKYNILPKDRTYYVASYGDPFPSLELTSLVQGFRSVSAFALAIAIYMSCNPIYLLGFDHDYLAHRGIDHHFYEGSAIKNHITEQVPLNALQSYDEEMRALEKLWQNYRSLKKIADQNGIQIFNASENSYLDVFTKVNYSEIITK